MARPRVVNGFQREWILLFLGQYRYLRYWGPSRTRDISSFIDEITAQCAAKYGLSDTWAPITADLVEPSPEQIRLIKDGLSGDADERLQSIRKVTSYHRYWPAGLDFLSRLSSAFCLRPRARPQRRSFKHNKPRMTITTVRVTSVQ